MKRIMGILLAVMLTLSLGGFALASDAATPAATPAPPVDLSGAPGSAEIAALAEQLKTLALGGAPLNDPAGEDARYEDGILMRYEFASLYCDRTEMTAETEIQAFSIQAGRDLLMRGTGIDSSTEEVLAQYPNGNPEMNGTRNAAILYLADDGEGSFRYGMIVRDGQRLRQIIYGSAEKEGEQYRLARLTYHLQSGMVSEIQATGLGAAGLADASLRNELYQEIRSLIGEGGYRRVPTSATGTDLTAFGPEDLHFGAFNLDGGLPEELPGNPDIFGPEAWDENSWAIRVAGDGYEAVYTCEADGSHPQLLSFDITGEDLEGPRAVRLGDALYEDMNRFRHGENETDGVTELLYGEAGKAPYGMADYAGDDGMSLTYATLMSDGREIQMKMGYEGAMMTSLYLMVISD